MSRAKFYKVLILIETFQANEGSSCYFHVTEWKKGTSEMLAGWAVFQEGHMTYNGAIHHHTSVIDREERAVH